MKGGYLVSSHHRGKTQLKSSKVLVIPENKPDIEKVLRVTSLPEIIKVSTITGTVVLTGKVKVLVEYVACSTNNSQPIHFAEFEITFSHFIAHPCIKRCQNANVCIGVEFQEVRVLNRRSLTIFLILKAIVLKIGAVNIAVEPQSCPAQNIINMSPGASALCFQEKCVEESLNSPPCLFGTGVVEFE